MSVQHRSEFVGTFRWIEVRLMEMLASWVATTPEMEVKVLFGRHVWDCAQHADALGKRAFELRAPLHFSLAPMDAYCDFLITMDSLTDTVDRIEGFYDCVMPGLTQKYHNYLQWTDDLMDEPTVRIVQSILNSQIRMQQDCADLRCADSGLHPNSNLPRDLVDDFVVHCEETNEKSEARS